MADLAQRAHDAVEEAGVAFGGPCFVRVVEEMLPVVSEYFSARGNGDCGIVSLRFPGGGDFWVADSYVAAVGYCDSLGPFRSCAGGGGL